MLTLKDPILTVSPPPGGIQLPPLREPESLETPSSHFFSTSMSQMVLKATKGERSFDWVGSRSALPKVVRQMKKYGWTVTVHEESPTPL